MDTRKHYSDTAKDFILLHQVRRDAAIGFAPLGVGLPRPGNRTLSLLDYRRQKEREVTRSLAGAAFLKAIVDECRAEVKKLIEEADTPGKRREILPEVERLNQLATVAAAELEALTEPDTRIDSTGVT